MTDTKMLQAIASSISLVREDIKRLDNKIDNLDKKLSDKIDKVDARVTKLGLNLAQLEDDAPTRAEHNHLSKRVTKIEKKLNII